MRTILTLAASAMLAACGVGKAETMGAGSGAVASVQTNSALEAAMNEAGEVSNDTAVTNASSTEANGWPDGHLPANWDHVPGDILVLEYHGFSFTQPGLHPYRYIDFGLARAVVVRGVTAIRGRPTGSGRDAHCAGGPMDFTTFGALVLNFRHGRFVGWVLNPGARPLIETFLGLGIGTPREQVGYGDADLESTRPSPFGPQFEVSGIGGFLNSDRANGRVARLYAGATCIARTPPQPQD